MTYVHNKKVGRGTKEFYGRMKGLRVAYALQLVQFDITRSHLEEAERRGVKPSVGLGANIWVDSTKVFGKLQRETKLGLMRYMQELQALESGEFAGFPSIEEKTEGDKTKLRLTEFGRRRLTEEAMHLYELVEFSYNSEIEYERAAKAEHDAWVAACTRD